MARKDRLIEVYDYVRSHFPVHTKNDFADAIKYHRTYISSAMHGNERNLTDKLFMNICETFPGVFSLDYLLTGEGNLLTLEEEVKTNEMETSVAPSPQLPPAFDLSILIENAVKAATSYQDKLIATLEKQIAEKDNQIQKQADIIANLLESLKSIPPMVPAPLEELLKKYPFEIGVAEGKESPRAQV